MSLPQNESSLGQDIFGWVGSSLALVFYVAPIFPVIKLFKKELTVKEFPGILLTCSFLSCILWGCYGWIGNKLQVWVANYVGGAITLIWLVIYFIFFAECKIIPSIIYNVILFNFVFEIGFFCFYLDKYVDELGYVAMVFNILMYAAPGDKMLTVIKTKNKDLLPIHSSITGVVCSTCWFMYGIYDNMNPSLMVPNLIGMVCAIMQICVWCYAYKKGGDKKEETQDEERGNEEAGKNVDKSPLFHTVDSSEKKE